MIWDWELTKKAEKGLSRIERTMLARVFDALDRLVEEVAANSPMPPTGVKKLTGQDEVWRLRIGDYRLLFTREFRIVEERPLGIILVHDVGHRREIYRT
jgi:mRNA interferase RelE/StbE